ncbi:TldD/PmbA family protein [bacterium]|nr:TldD/PmbA family protein [bacterium]
MQQIAKNAVDEAVRLGAEYADARVCHYQDQRVDVRDEIVTNLLDREEIGVGVRCYYGGAWGFAATHVLTPEEIAATAARAVAVARASATLAPRLGPLAPVYPHVTTYVTPHEIDPFTVPLEEKIDLLLSITKGMHVGPEVRRAIAFMEFTREHKVFANSVGSVIDQTIIRSHASCTAFAVGQREFKTRMFETPPLNIGYEHIKRQDWEKEARRVGEEAVGQLSAVDVEPGYKTLVLSPSHLCLTIHESVGHPTELDRILGMEADMAGTSFVKPEMLGRFQYGSPLVNLVADRTMPNGRSTVGFDDDGVPTRRFDVVRDGVLVGVSTNRETAFAIGDEDSRACNYADGYNSTPIVRIPNLCLQPGGKDAPTLEELISDTEDGILIDGRGSFSIDHQRYNFQFGGDCFWEIKHGKIGRMLKNVTYRANSTDFWRSLDAVCNADYWQPQGVVNCGKGQPGQRAQMTHGAPWARFRNIKVGEAR